MIPLYTLRSVSDREPPIWQFYNDAKDFGIEHPLVGHGRTYNHTALNL